MVPILFEYDSTSFDGLGLGELYDTISCIVKSADDGSYELDLEYPLDGKMLSELKINRIILAKANPRDPNQAFRIYGYEKNINNIITVKCHHISYDLNDIIFFPYAAYYTDFIGKCTHSAYTDPRYLINDIKNSDYILYGTNNFSVTGAVYDSRGYPYGSHVIIDHPMSLRSALFGSGGLIDVFGGVCRFNNFNLYFTDNPTQSGYNNFNIYYGIDLIDLRQEENNLEVYTGIIPYYKGKDKSLDGNTVTRAPESVVLGDVQYAEGNFERQRILPVDVTSVFSDTKNSNIIDLDIWTSGNPGVDYIPTKAEVDNQGRKLIATKKYGVPNISISVDAAHIDRNICLYDIVHVHFVKFGINVDSRVNSLEYDTLRERINQIELGRTMASGLWSFWDSEYKKGR